jgi:hypothetical protein
MRVDEVIATATSGRRNGPREQPLGLKVAHRTEAVLVYVRHGDA